MTLRNSFATVLHQHARPELKSSLGMGCSRP